MRRIAAGLFLCFVLSGCMLSRSVETDEVGIRNFYENLEEIEQKITISAEFPNYVSEYLITYEYRKDGDHLLTVLEPESIAGVTVTLRDGAAVLSVDELQLETGSLDKNGLTPISALPKLFDSWETHPSGVESVRENGCDYLLLDYEDDAVLYRTVFSRETYLPIRAEVFCDDECVLRLQYAAEGEQSSVSTESNLGGDLS